MRQYIFEVRLDGSLGARYCFDTSNVPAQVIRPGCTELTVRLTGQETQDELDLIQTALVRPHAVTVENGKMTRKPERGR